MRSRRAPGPSAAEREPQGRRSGVPNDSRTQNALWRTMSLRVQPADDPLEREADRTVERVLAGPNAGESPSAGRVERGPRRVSPRYVEEERIRRKADRDGGAPTAPAMVGEVIGSPGQPLESDTRRFFEPRLGRDLGDVRIHTGTAAARSARSMNARAYTVGNQVVFGAGQYAPGTPAGRRLLAHELVHVAQQADGARPEGSSPRRRPARTPSVQRALEVRPPGRGEASAFDRRQELIDRLNAQSPAIQYRLEGRAIHYDVIDEASLTSFDRQMRGFIDRAELVPMRLITSAGRVDGQSLLVDSLMLGYVDLEDMLASSDHSFQMNLVHFIAERFRIRNYARRIGTNITQAEFDRAHQAGIAAETELLRDVLGDPTIRFVYEETRPNGTLVFGFRSAEGYWVFHVFRGSGRALRGGDIFVRTADSRRLSLEEFRAERGVGAPAIP